MYLSQDLAKINSSYHSNSVVSSIKTHTHNLKCTERRNKLDILNGFQDTYNHQTFKTNNPALYEIVQTLNIKYIERDRL